MVIVGRKPAAAYVDKISLNFQQLKQATQNFHSHNKIGEGSFGRVYKGVLSNGKEIAVKQFFSTMQGKQQFLKELGIVSALNHHPNLVKFFGCCSENSQLLLIYEYMENDSLYNTLFGTRNLKSRLDWQTRFEICLGIAKGLAFLHEESALKIIHGDIKLSSVLLDKHFKPKLSSFGFAIIHNDHEEEKEHVHVTQAVRSAWIRLSCYSAPEYAFVGSITYKVDVYSFGIMMLEIVSGKTNTERRPNMESVYLIARACALYEKGKLLELMDLGLEMDYNVSQAEIVLNLAILCINISPARWPKMSEVVNILQGKTQNHEKEPLAGDHADIKEDTAPTVLHDHLSTIGEEEEEEEDNADIPDEFDGNSSISKVNDHQSTIEGGQKNDAKLLMERKFPVLSGPSESSNARKSWSSTTLFMDHVTKMNEKDKGKLKYVEPSFDEDGKLCIRYSEEEFEEGCNEWKDSLVGFFVGDDKPLIMNTILNKENVETLWGVKGDDDAVSFFSMEDGYFLIQFKYAEDKIKVLESSPWHIENRPLILREWNCKLKFDKANEIKTLPIWVKIYNLPLFLWTPSFLSKVGSALGTPLYSDQKTKNKERLDFARLCIQVDASKPLPNYLNISIKDIDYEIRFEYDWKPLQCAKTEGTKPLQCAKKTEDTIFLCFLLNLSVLLAFQFIFMFI